MLVLLRELTLETSLKESLGKIVFESIPFTLGVALASQLLGDSRNDNTEGFGTEQVNSTTKNKGDDLHAPLPMSVEP